MFYLKDIDLVVFEVCLVFCRGGDVFFFFPELLKWNL